MKAHLETPIAIRAYSERPEREPLGSRSSNPDGGPSEWTLAFDCETTTDAAQRLKFGFFQVRRGERLAKEGAFFDARALSIAELACLRKYAKLHDLSLLTVEQFRTDIFLKYGFDRRALIVGFNLPFDISRIAVRHGPARRVMRGGFSFDITGKSFDPRVRVKHLTPRAALIDFAIPGEQETPRSWRKQDRHTSVHRGHFVDIKTLASALLSGRFSLQSLAAYLHTPTQKHETDEHGRVTDAYLSYARADVQVTWECFHALMQQFGQHDLGKGPDRMLSEASIGKAYLQKMGIKPFLGCNPTFPREQFAELFCGYYGGRAEVHLRRVVCEVRYCDFKSMYPTVNALMWLWPYVIAEGITIEDSTAKTQRFLDGVTIEDLQRPETWKKLCVLVQLVPQDDILPVRASYDDQTYTIGLNHLTTAEPLWFTLADCIASKLLTGRAPRILKAQTYKPARPQRGLKSTRILGRPDFTIDPAKQDFFTRLVDLRDEAKSQGQPIEKALKIIANSTSYGIFIEITRDNAPKAEPLMVFGPGGQRERIMTKAIEDPGRYFHPLLGVLITGAARLMLAIAERKTLDLGLGWAFCDTDSLAIVRPGGMTRREFHRRADQVIAWFVPLNPYKKPGSILKLEDVNFKIGCGKSEPLYCYAISAKRYALFNRARDGRPVIRKASAHGLGHLLDPYSESESPADIPLPSIPLKSIGLRRWQYDLWYKIVEAALKGDPDRVPLEWHPGLQRPAAIRYTASSPPLLDWMARWNKGRPYPEQVRPFNFLMYATPRKGLSAVSRAEILKASRRGRPPKIEPVFPIAPYDTDPARALAKVFDRVTGKPISRERLKTYAEVLAQYHLSPEGKFENGQFLDRGRTERRHVVATGFVWIGKEANCVGESGDPDPIQSAVSEFGRTSSVHIGRAKKPRLPGPAE